MNDDDMAILCHFDVSKSEKVPFLAVGMVEMYFAILLIAETSQLIKSYIRFEVDQNHQ